MWCLIVLCKIDVMMRTNNKGNEKLHCSGLDTRMYTLWFIDTTNINNNKPII